MRARAWPFALLLALALSATASPLRAGGVVGDGTPASCTEAALNARLAGGGNLTFDCGGGAVTIPITATKVITTSTSIDGTGQAITLDGGGTTRLFLTTYQFSPFTITLRNLTLRNGRAADFGAAIRLAYQEPANWTTLNVINVSFLNNVCSAAGNDVGGGAIYAQGGYVNVSGSVFNGNVGGNGGAIGNLQAVLTIDGTLFVGNSTHPQSGGGGNGGAIYVDGSSNSQLTIRASWFARNTATNLGGAIHVYQYAGASGLLIEDTTFDGNTTVNNGGAIYHQNGNLTIDRSTFVGNQTVGQGGALWLLESASAIIRNSTFSANRANGYRPNNGSVGLGGAILINDASSVTISHTTIVGNFADWVGGGICGGMGGSSTTLRASIVANNTAANGGNPWNIGFNCSSQLNDGGYNIQYPARNPTDPNDHDCTAAILIAEPKLAPLADYGGLSQTMPPYPGSPALDGVGSGCPPPSVDQRSRSRPVGALCDVGAAEGSLELIFKDGFESGDLSGWSAYFPLAI